jgi:hypothetical protein
MDGMIGDSRRARAQYDQANMPLDAANGIRPGEVGG